MSERHLTELTARQHQVLTFAIEGKSVKQTAWCLGLGVSTIEVHRKEAMRNLGAANMVQAAVLYDRMRRDLVSGAEQGD